jgi:ATP-binding cassette, subfamily B, bacterial PglK
MKFSKLLLKLLIRLWRHISSRRQRQFTLLLILMILVSFAEIISIGAVLPFLGILTAPRHVFEHPLLQPLMRTFEINTPEQLLLPITIIFGLTVLIAGGMRLLLVWANTRISFATGADLGINIYHRTLYQPFSVHVARNSGEVINGITGKANSVINNVILPILILISSSIMLTAILIVLLVVDPIIAMASFSGFGVIYAFIILITRKKLLLDSQCIARESTNVIKSLQEGLGGIRDILIDGNQDAYCQIYRNADIPLRRSQGNVVFIGSSPRYVMEALGMTLITVLAYALAQQPDGIAKAIPILGALALGAQRLLPVLQQAYGAWTNMLGGYASLQDTLELLDQPLPDFAGNSIVKPIPFNKQINLKNVSHRYNLKAPWVLKDLNLTIDKGSCTGFIGTTGSGKSTLLDIIMGLLSATNGALEIDGKLITMDNQRTWHAHVAHVPQAIFLADSTIEENIAFGIPKDQIDYERVRLAARQAQIADIIETWPKQYQTFVGERGIRLSGGQRQRIGIARAMYKQANVIIFDEATSALDNETERAVMQAIEGLSGDVTILIIAHRLTTLKNCTQIVDLSNGKIKRTGSYKEIMR